jgi:hypothetical protein
VWWKPTAWPQPPADPLRVVLEGDTKKTEATLVIQKLLTQHISKVAATRSNRLLRGDECLEVRDAVSKGQLHDVEAAVAVVPVPHKAQPEGDIRVEVAELCYQLQG